MDTKQERLTPIDLCRAAFQNNPQVTFAEVKEAGLALKPKLIIYPIVYGRAKQLEGLATAKPKKKAAENFRNRPRRVHPPEFKAKVVAYASEYDAKYGSGAQAATAKKFGINPSMVGNWSKQAAGRGAPSTGKVGIRKAPLVQPGEVVEKRGTMRENGRMVYDVDFKLEVAQWCAANEGHGVYKAAAAKFGIDRSMVGQWCKAVGAAPRRKPNVPKGNTKTPRAGYPRRKFDDDKRAEVLAWWLANGRNASRAGEHFGVSNSVVSGWIKIAGYQAIRGPSTGKRGVDAAVANEAAPAADALDLLGAMRQVQQRLQDNEALINRMRKLLFQGLTEAQIREFASQ